MFSIVVDIQGMPAMRKQELNNLHKKSWRSLGMNWRKRYLKGHFTHRGGRKYNYTPRKGERPGQKPIPYSYTGRKLKQVGHTRPLEFYGEGKRQALTQKRVVSTKERCKIRLPNKFNFKHPRSKVVMRDEIRAVHQSERRPLATHMRDDLEKRLRRVGKHTRFHFSQ